MSLPSTGRLGAVTASRTVLRDVGVLQVLIGGLMFAPLLESLFLRGKICELTVDEAAPIAGLSLIDANADRFLPEETVIVAIVRGDELHVPRGESEIRVGDTVKTFATDGPSIRITDTLRGANHGK